MKKPTVDNIIQRKDINFSLTITAYRKMTESELRYALALWLKNSGYKNIPENIHGTMLSHLD